MEQRLSVKKVVGMLVLTLSIFCFSLGETRAASQSSLPETVYWGYRFLGSGIATSAVSIVDKIGPQLGRKIRMIPGEDVDMVAMLRAKKVHFATFVADAYWASMGLIQYSTFAYGPQPIRTVWPGAPMPGASTGYATVSSGIKTPYDLKGKRLARVVGAAWSELGLRGSLAFGKLTYDDVSIVQVSSTAMAYKAMLEGKADFAMGMPTSPVLFEVEASPHGLYAVDFPAEDKSGWERYRQFMPFVTQGFGSVGAGIKPRKNVSMVAYPMPVTNTIESQPEELVYAVCDAIYNKLNEIVAAYSMNEGMKLETALTPESTFLAPYHPGAVKFFKKIGLWTKELDEANDKKVRHLQKVSERWNTFVEESERRMSQTKKKVDSTEEWPQIVEKEIGLRP